MKCGHWRAEDWRKDGWIVIVREDVFRWQEKLNWNIIERNWCYFSCVKELRKWRADALWRYWTIGGGGGKCVDPRWKRKEDERVGESALSRLVEQTDCCRNWKTMNPWKDKARKAMICDCNLALTSVAGVSHRVACSLCIALNAQHIHFTCNRCFKF